MKRKLTVTITKVRRRVAAVSANVSGVRCPICQREVESVRGSQVAELMEIASQTVNDLTDSSTGHAVQAVNDGLRVSKDYLLAEHGEAEPEVSKKE